MVLLPEHAVMGHAMTDKQSRLSETILTGFLVFSSLGIFIYFLIQLSAYYNDDAYIVLRYAKNFLEGKGLVWNAGERVEGYSCFFWLMLISLLGYVKINLVLASKILGVLFAFLTFVLLFIFDQQKRFIGALLLATNSCFALWALGGLETVPFGFFIFLGCCLFLKKKRAGVTLLSSGLVFSIAAMTRPEGILFFSVTVLFCLFEDKRITPQNLGNALLFIIGFFVCYLPYFVWRLLYYGQLFPCTFYVKGGSNIFKLLFGARYTFHFLIMFAFPLLSMVFVKNWKRFFSDSTYLITLLLGYFMYILVIGGDHMQGFRFYVPVLPLLYLFVQECFYAARFGRNSIPFNVLFIFIIGLNFFVSYRSILWGPEAAIDSLSHSYKYRTCLNVPEPAAYVGKVVGLYMKDHWPNNALVAGNAAGAIPYYSEIAFLDMLGLTDYTIAKREITYDSTFLIKDLLDIKKLISARGRSHIMQNISSRYLPWQLIPGHAKGDARYVLSRKPDFIIIGPCHGSLTPWFLGDREILSSPEFQQHYRLKEVPIQIFDKFYTFYEPTKTGTLTFRYYEKKKQGS